MGAQNGLTIAGSRYIFLSQQITWSELRKGRVDFMSWRLTRPSSSVSMRIQCDQNSAQQWLKNLENISSLSDTNHLHIYFILFKYQFCILSASCTRSYSFYPICYLITEVLATGAASDLILNICYTTVDFKNENGFKIWFEYF